MVAAPLRQVWDGADCLLMQYSAQIACALAGVLLVIPMYYLGRDLFDRRVGFWSALLFQVMPVPSRALSDGLTEGIYLLLTATFVLVAGRALRNRSVLGFAVCGLISGVGYLARPETAALAGILGSMLVALQLRPALRWPTRHWVPALVVLPTVAIAVALPYMLVIGGFSNKLTFGLFFQRTLDTSKRVDCDGVANERVPCFRGSVPGQSPGVCTAKACGPCMDGMLSRWFREVDQLGEGSAKAWHPPPYLTNKCEPTSPGRLGIAPLFAAWEGQWKGVGIGKMSSFGWALTTFFKEVGKGFHYGYWVAGFLGLAYFYRRIRSNPTAWLLLALAGFYTVVLLRMARVAGYISERHTLIFVFCAVPWIIAAIYELPWRLTLLARRLRFPKLISEWGGQLGLVRAALLPGIIVICLPASLQALHPSRLGFREAGFWLAQNAHPLEKLVDPFCWAEYYAGRVFTPPLPDEAPTRYVVLDNIYSFDHHSHLPSLDLAKRLAENGELVYHWPTSAEPERALVFIYALPEE
jgi:4-amino-4-deoxy-L-arabinose transferase-like glycosyltransferase